MNLTTQNSHKTGARLSLTLLDLLALVVELQVRVEVADERALIASVCEGFLDFVEHCFLNLNYCSDLLVHLVLQLLIFERFPGVKCFLSHELFVGLDFVLGEIYESSNYMPLGKDFILPAGQEDLFGHRSLLRDSLAQY